jgi:hypothetical protein
MIDNQNWYYTLSAIAQTCGAILALGGTFIVFRLDRLESALINYRDRFVKAILPNANGTSEASYSDKSNEEILIEYKNSKDKIYFEGGNGVEVESDITNRIDSNYTRKISPAEWIIHTAKMFKTNIDAKSTIHFHFKLILTILTSIIVVNLFFLAFLDPRIYAVTVSFYILVPISLMSIITVAILFWRILKIRIITY